MGSCCELVSRGGWVTGVWSAWGHISARVGSGLRKKRSRPCPLSWMSLAEGSGVFAKHWVCRAVLGGLCPLSTSLMSPHADQSPCGESANSPLALIPGGFPSSRKHKPPSSIIHQVLNFIEEPPDTLAVSSTLLPGGKVPGPSVPRGQGRKRVRFPWPRGGRSFFRRRQIQQGLWCLCFPFSEINICFSSLQEV